MTIVALHSGTTLAAHCAEPSGERTPNYVVSFRVISIVKIMWSENVHFVVYFQF